MHQAFVVREELAIRAPVERCFALSTNLAVVEMVLKMRPVGGRMSGEVTGGDTVRWRGWKWGLPHVHESLIDPFVPPVFFRDRMIAGRFAEFEHDHHFVALADGAVLLRDELRFALPGGTAGRLVGWALVRPHIQRLLRERFALIRQLAEGEQWRRYLAPERAVATG